MPNYTRREFGQVMAASAATLRACPRRIAIIGGVGRLADGCAGDQSRSLQRHPARHRMHRDSVRLGRRGWRRLRQFCAG